MGRLSPMGSCTSRPLAHALDGSSGELICVNLESVDSAPAVADGVVYFGSDDRNIYALDAANGKLIWRYETNHWVTTSPAVANGVLYIGGHDSNVYALDAASGELIWRYETGRWALIRSWPIA